MGKKGKWFSSVKKAFSPESKEKKEQKAKQKLAQKQTDPESLAIVLENGAPPQHQAPLPHLPSSSSVSVEVQVSEVVNEQSTAVAATPATNVLSASSQAAQEAVRCTRNARFAGKSKEEVAAIKIQTTFRGYLARRALRALRGLVRLRALMEGPAVKRQSVNTLKCMQTLSRVQSQIRARRIRLSEENQARQRQLLQKHAKELARTGEEWDDSMQSKEQIEASLLSKYEAAMRRERALAYAYSHQQTWKNSTRSVNLMFMDPTNPSWGWSWLERWMGGQPLEKSSATEKEPSNSLTPLKNLSRSIAGGEVTKSYIRHQLNSSTQPNSPTGSLKSAPRKSQLSPFTPSKLSSSRKPKPFNPRVNIPVPDDDTKSTTSVLSNRRHSIAGSSVRDDDSLAGSPALPSYMVPTESARAKLKSQSPLGAAEENATPEKGPEVGLAKKKLSYPASPAKPRRFSAPPKVENSVNGEITVTDGGGS